MAKGQRGRGGRQRNIQPTAPQRAQQRPSRRRSRGGAEAGAEELPTAAPGSAGLPGGSAFGGSVTANAPAIARPVEKRSRGGPRSRAERHRLRGAAVVYDFRYVPSDLRWISLTTVASVALVLILWAVIRL